MSKMPGRMVLTRMPSLDQVARDRQGHADDAALGGRIGGLADLAVLGRDRGGVDDRAALAVRRAARSVSMPAADLAMQRKVPTRLIWMMRSKASSGKCLISPVSLSRLAVLIGVAGAGAVDQDALLAVGGAGLGEAGVDLFVGRDVDLAEDAADFLGDGFALALRCRSKMATLTPCAASARAVAAPRPEAPPVTTAAMEESSFI